jgi:formylglycine-generating enzyme required for sulfatase activity
VTLYASYAACAWSANGYRLSTEAEWERAARGGPTGLRFPWGGAIASTNANFAGTSTCPVAVFDANGYGLHDMIGNVWEWCWDYYGGYSLDYASNPIGPTSSGDGRVLRGGSWEDSAWGVRVARRQYLNPEETFGVIGFRTVRRVQE